MNRDKNTEFGERIIIEKGFMRVARSPHKVILPEILDEDFAYLTGYHLGDGYLEDSLKSQENRGKSGYEIDYADSDKQQLLLINSIFNDKFAFNFRIYKRPTANLYIARAHCKVIHIFLNKRLGIPLGEKNIINMPNWILNEKKFISCFLSGFFDAEGDVGKTGNRVVKGKKYYKLRIQLTQRDKNILLEIKTILKETFGIVSDIHPKWHQDAYILRIGSARMAKKFKNQINFRNSTKRGKLALLISEFDKKHATG